MVRPWSFEYNGSNECGPSVICSLTLQFVSKFWCLTIFLQVNELSGWGNVLKLSCYLARRIFRGQGLVNVQVRIIRRSFWYHTKSWGWTCSDLSSLRVFWPCIKWFCVILSPFSVWPISHSSMIVTKMEPQSERVSGPLSLTDCFVSIPPDGRSNTANFRSLHKNSAAAKCIYSFFKGMAPEVGTTVSWGKESGDQHAVNGSFHYCYKWLGAVYLSWCSNGLWAGWPGFNCGQG
jgi:hypothetical protein